MELIHLSHLGLRRRHPRRAMYLISHGRLREHEKPQSLAASDATVGRVETGRGQPLAASFTPCLNFVTHEGLRESDGGGR
jgi:hypothetical protein